MTKCDTCAFRAGTEANTNGVTLIMATLCAQTVEEFFCHENALPDGSLPEGEEHICDGYDELVTKLNQTGFYTREPEWKQQVREGLKDVIEQAIDDNKAGIAFDLAVFQQRIRAQYEGIDAMLG